MISLDNLTVSYGGWTLFDNISFLINPKDRIGLVGKNGAGKTTLLRIITGEQQPTSGAVTINGECTIGYLPQTVRTIRTRSTDDIAMGTFLMMGLGSAAFAVQGILTHNIPLFATNLLTTTMSAIIFGIKIYNDYFKKR